MSQKKLKKLRKTENTDFKDKDVNLKDEGVRKILINNWKFLLLLCVGIVVFYFNSLWGGYVSDDYASITQNPDIMSIKAAWMSSPVSFFANFYKTVIAKIFGISSPIPFHVGNLVLYLIICILAFIFLSLFFENLVARLALVIFAFLPVHVEAVSWISGEPYLLTSLLVLTELINCVLFLRTKKKKYLFLILIAGIVSFLTDRIRGFSFIIILGLIIISFPEKVKLKLNIFGVLSAILLAFGLLLVVAWPMINNRISSVNSGVNLSESNFYNPLFQYPTAIPKYLQMIVFPFDLTLYHTMYIIPVWMNWAILLVYLSGVVWFWFKNKKIFFALVFIFAATAPSMAPVKVSWLVAERYVFLGSLGMALLMAIYFEKWWLKKQVLTLIGLIVLCSIYGARIILRNIDWQTNHNLWVNTCQVSPNSHNAWNNIGDDYDKLANAETSYEGKIRQYYNSIKGFGQSYAVKPNYADAYHNQANIFYKIGRLDLARNGYETAIHYNPGLFQTYLTLIQIDLAEKNEKELLKHLAIIQQIKPNDLQVAYISAISYAQIGKTEDAKIIADMMYKQFPNITEIKNLYNSLQNVGATTSGAIKAN